MKKTIVILSTLVGILLAQSVTFSGVPSQITAGQSFTITITSSNSSDAGLRVINLIENGTVLPNPQDYIEPSTFTFSNGSAQVNIIVYRAGDDMKFGVQGYTGESNSFKVVPAAFKRIQLLFPGETADPGNRGTGGKSGTPDTTTAGVPITTVKVRTTDDYWNLISSQNANVYFSSTDPYAKFPHGMSITGEKEITITMRRKGSHTVSVASSSGGSATDHSSIYVKDAGFTKLLILAPGETHEPGDTLTVPVGMNYPGKTGEYDQPKVGEAYPLTILAVDSCWNEVESVDKNYPIYFFTVGPEDIIYDTTVHFSGDTTSVVDNVIFTSLGVYNLQPLVKGGVQSGYTWQIKVELTSYTLELTRRNEGKYLIVNEMDSIVGKVFTPVGEDSLKPADNVSVKFILSGDDAELIPIGDTIGVKEYETTTASNGEASVFFKALKEGEYTIKFEITKDTTIYKEMTIQVVKPSYSIKAYPSPMNKGDVANIEYILENEAKNITLLITDMYGYEVLRKELKGRDDVSVGRKIYEWDGFNSAGARVVSGVYLVIVKIEYEDRAPEIRKTHLLILW